VATEDALPGDVDAKENGGCQPKGVEQVQGQIYSVSLFTLYSVYIIIKTKKTALKLRCLMRINTIYQNTYLQ